MLTRCPSHIEAITGNIISRDEMYCHYWSLHGDCCFTLSTECVYTVLIKAINLQHQGIHGCPLDI